MVWFRAAWRAFYAVRLFAVVRSRKLLTTAFAVNFAVMADVPMRILIGACNVGQRIRAFRKLASSLILFENG